ncbi:ParB N-terminal domain-containing protein [Thioclava sp.]|uniref:ParB/RepB/Spo0J family partition protein n=1 Tax=Thioclava sp. TaxID=1933450 RepID=UPI003242DC79
MAKSPTLMTVDRVAVAEVTTADRLRPVSEAGVESLIASIGEVGVMKDAIHVRQKKGGTLHLIAGAHRLEAAKRLGWNEIEAKVWTDVTDDWALLMEIDDNLAGAEMNALDTAVFLARRKEIYERLHPETKRGVAGAAARWDATEPSSVAFVTATAEKFGLSDRQVRKIVAAGLRLDPKDVSDLRSAPRAVTLKDLTEIGKINDPVERYRIVEGLASGKAKSVRDVLRTLRPANETEPKDPVETSLKGLSEAWSRAPLAARRRFLEAHEEELRKLLANDDIETLGAGGGE